MLGQLPPWADGVAVGVGVVDEVTVAGVTTLVGTIAIAIQAAAPAPSSARTAAVPITNCLTRLFNTLILRSAGPRARLRRSRMAPISQLGHVELGALAAHAYGWLG